MLHRCPFGTRKGLVRSGAALPCPLAGAGSDLEFGMYDSEMWVVLVKSILFSLNSLLLIERRRLNGKRVDWAVGKFPPRLSAGKSSGATILTLRSIGTCWHSASPLWHSIYGVAAECAAQASAQIKSSPFKPMVTKLLCDASISTERNKSKKKSSQLTSALLALPLHDCSAQAKWQCKLQFFLTKSTQKNI